MFLDLVEAMDATSKFECAEVLDCYICTLPFMSDNTVCNGMDGLDEAVRKNMWS